MRSLPRPNLRCLSLLTSFGIVVGMLAVTGVPARAAQAPLALESVGQQAVLNGGLSDDFGISVAVSGDTAVVGAYRDTSFTGAVYVFTRSGATWSQQQKITRAGGAVNDYFGSSVAISGNTVVVGAHGVNSSAGAAYVFTRSGTTWTQQQALTSGDAGALQFGSSVAVSGDSAVVGAPSANSNAGAAYVFTRSGTTWTHQQRLVASDGAAGYYFGTVAIDGDTAVVGAFGHNATYVFTRSGTVWTQQQKLTASDAAVGDDFGYSVGVSADTAVIGNEGHNSGEGSAYVFTRSGTTWTQQKELTAADGAAGDNFGDAVGVSGNSAVIGARLHDAGNGAAYLFTRSGTTWGLPQEVTDTAGASRRHFGWSAAVDGTTTLVGALGRNASSGAAYVFVPAETTPPVVTISLDSPNGGTPDGQNGWFVTAPVTGTVTANGDEPGGTDIVAMTCTRAVNGASPQSLGLTNRQGIGTATIATGDFSLAAEGTTVVSCTAKDQAGNTSQPKTATVTVDSRAPSITASVTPASPASTGWYNATTGAPTEHLKCLDPKPGSGIADGDCPASVKLANGGNQSVSRAVSDIAGNQSTPATVSGLNVDTTPPGLACVKPAPILLLNQSSAQISATVTDATSGPASPTASAPAVTSAVGGASVSLTGFDLAGNSRTVSCSYTVAYGFGGFTSPGLNTSWIIGSTIPVSFGLTNASGTKISNAVAQSLVTGGKVHAQLRLGGVQKASASCSYNVTVRRFACGILVTSGLATGKTYFVAAVEDVGTGFIVAPAAPGATTDNLLAVKVTA